MGGCDIDDGSVRAPSGRLESTAWTDSMTLEASMTLSWTAGEVSWRRTLRDTSSGTPAFTTMAVICCVGATGAVASWPCNAQEPAKFFGQPGREPGLLRLVQRLDVLV